MAWEHREDRAAVEPVVQREKGRLEMFLEAGWAAGPQAEGWAAVEKAPTAAQTEAAG